LNDIKDLLIDSLTVNNLAAFVGNVQLGDQRVDNIVCQGTFQFSNEFNVRLVSQKNTFTDQFFIQPLVQWNPNPSTIFYLGGNQNTIEEIEGAHFQLLQFNQTQFFFKFQYLIGL